MNGTRHAILPDVRLVDLVEHTEWVGADETVEAVYDAFRRHDHEYAAVVDRTGVTGICSRGHVSGLIAGQYGFALYRRAPISQHMGTASLLFCVDVSLTSVLDQSLSRVGDAFYEDVVLVNHDSSLFGLISTARLVNVQSAFLRAQFQLLDSQRTALETSNDELSRSLSHRRALERQMVDKEKAMLVQTLAGGVAHELNNKLMPVLGYAELLLDAVGESHDESLTRYCHAVLEGALDAARIIRQLLQLSVPVSAEHAVEDLRLVVEQGLTLVQLRLKESATTLVLDLPSDAVPVLVDDAQIKQVLLNLMLNAIDAMEHSADRHVEIRLERVESQAVISMTDRGTGIAPDIIARIFDPFFTTKAPNRGTGLGLSVCQSIVRRHGGTITVDSIVGEGTTFHLTLPLHAGATDAIDRQTDIPATTARRYAGYGALVIEDDDAVAGLAIAALESRLACGVERASDGRAALALIERTNYAMILCDVRMPHMSGGELFQWIRRHRPELVPSLIFMTGDGGESSQHSDIERAHVPILRKPFAIDTLVALASTIFDQARPESAPNRS